MKSLVSISLGMMLFTSVAFASDSEGWRGLIGRTFELDQSRSSKKCTADGKRLSLVFSSEEGGVNARLKMDNFSTSVMFDHINGGPIDAHPEHGMDKNGEWHAERHESKWDGSTLSLHFWGWSGWTLFTERTNDFIFIEVMSDDTLKLTSNSTIVYEKLSLKKDSCFFRLAISEELL